MRDSRRKRLQYAVVYGEPDIERTVGLDNGDLFIMLWIGYAEQPSTSDRPRRPINCQSDSGSG